MGEREDRAAWDRLAAQMRDAGGILENVRLGRGPRGRGLFVERRGEPSRIVLPHHLLIPVDAVEMRDGRPVVKEGADIAPEARNLFDDYHASIGFPRDMQRDARRAIAGQHNLPAPVQNMVLKGNPDGLSRFPAYDEHSLLDWFFNTRAIQSGQTRAMMPLLEIVNHDASAPSFIGRNGGVRVEGTYEDEVLVRYHEGDPWSVYLRWGFAAPSDRAYSLGLEITEPSGWKVKVIAETRPTEAGENTKVTVDGNRMIIERLLLASPTEAGSAGALFRSQVAAFGLADANELFSIINKINKDWFRRLLALGTGSTANPGLKTLRAAVKFQLKWLDAN